MKFDAKESRTGRVPEAAPGSDRRPDHRRRSDDHEHARRSPATSSRCWRRSWRISRTSGSAPSRSPTGRSASSPTRTRTTCCACSKKWSPRQEPRPHGPLQPSGGTAPADRAAGGQAHRIDRRDAAHAGATDPPHQRRPERLGRAVDDRRAARRDSVLHVRRARYRAERYFELPLATRATKSSRPHTSRCPAWRARCAGRR